MVGGEFAEAEVAELDVAAAVEEDVVGLEVAVDVVLEVDALDGQQLR